MCHHMRVSACLPVLVSGSCGGIVPCGWIIHWAVWSLRAIIGWWGYSQDAALCRVKRLLLLPRNHRSKQVTYQWIKIWGISSSRYGIKLLIIIRNFIKMFDYCCKCTLCILLVSFIDPYNVSQFCMVVKCSKFGVQYDGRPLVAVVLTIDCEIREIIGCSCFLVMRHQWVGAKQLLREGQFIMIS